MCHNNISDSGLCSLSEALETNISVKQVTIWGNKIGEPTCLVCACSHSLREWDIKCDVVVSVQEFYRLLQSGRLLPGNTDVEPYRVDGVNYLALAR